MNSEVTDTGLEMLGDHRDNLQLCLPGSRITDAGIEALTRNAHLNRFDFRNTAVTDSGLQELARLKDRQLDEESAVHVRGSRITRKGVDEFRRRCRYCWVLGTGELDPDFERFLEAHFGFAYLPAPSVPTR